MRHLRCWLSRPRHALQSVLCDLQSYVCGMWRDSFAKRVDFRTPLPELLLHQVLGSRIPNGQGREPSIPCEHCRAATMGRKRAGSAASVAPCTAHGTDKVAGRKRFCCRVHCVSHRGSRDSITEAHCLGFSVRRIEELFLWMQSSLLCRCVLRLAHARVSVNLERCMHAVMFHMSSVYGLLDRSRILSCCFSPQRLCVCWYV